VYQEGSVIVVLASYQLSCLTIVETFPLLLLEYGNILIPRV